jgi:hypothetical protein
MENKELIYELAKKLDMVIEVHKKGEYQGKYRFIGNKLHKLKEKPENVPQRKCGRDLH